ncbi:MAG TPA: M56 family metallopeptidase, partial [Verrucomicrobiae bacterium]|nr:M56 family metallopeptidase [Verrucomicrobiae bacterium]
MNSGPIINDWLRLLAVVGIELGAIAAVFALLQRVLVSPIGRRLSWRSALIGSLLIVGFELAGVSRWMAGWWSADVENEQRVAIVSANLEPTTELSSLPPNSLNPPSVVALNPPAHPSDHADNAPPLPVWWPGWLWLGGVMLLIGRMVVARLVFAAGLQRHRRFCDPQIARRVLELANLLGLSRPIRVFQLGELPTPISYGAFRAGIVLPVQFGQDNDDASRDAMLLHELAHVSARDGFWHGAGDLVVACLWWHPAVWWMRHEMESASELAADEASAAVENGPRVLAGCLVRMARKLTAPAGSGWQGIQGSRFRSRMGRRVERLLALGPVLPPGNRPARRWLERVAMMLLLGGMIVLGGLLSHRHATNGLSWRTSWHASFGGMFLSQLAAAEPEAPDEAVPQDRIEWIPWSDTAVGEALSQGRPVLVVFTADWAINTVVNEKVAL